jgi:uncharacterized repeat protein (TIGR02543 family)
MKRRSAGALALALLALGAAPAFADHQTGNVTLEVSASPAGAGRITGAGIDCNATCAQAIPLEAECTYVGSGGNHNQGRMLCETIYPTRTLTAAPAAGWTFAGWSGACTNATGACAVTVHDDPTRVVAHFTPLAGPSGSIVAPEEGAYVRGNVTIRAEASAPAGVKQVRFYLNNSSGALATLTEPPFEITRDSRFFVGGDGPHTFHAVITDNADQVFTTPVRTVTVDNAAPQLSLSGIEEGALIADSLPKLSFEATDTTPVTFVCSVDGVEGPCSDEGSHTPGEPLADGEHEIGVTATDSVGLETTASRSVRVDTVAPRVRITKKPKRKSSKRKAAFRFTADESASFKCKLDRKAWRACRSGAKFRVKPGKHTFRVRATDLAGNVGKAATYRFKVAR